MQKAESVGFRRCCLAPGRGDKGKFLIGCMDQENREGRQDWAPEGQRGLAGEFHRVVEPVREGGNMRVQWSARNPASGNQGSAQVDAGGHAGTGSSSSSSRHAHWNALLRPLFPQPGSKPLRAETVQVSSA